MKKYIQTLTENKGINSFALMLSAFLCYTGMYAVRKSFLAGQYTDLDLGFGVDAKTVLVVSQVLGYMISKFLGIKIISEMRHRRRPQWLIGLVSFALFMLLLFALLPAKLKFIALFLNGLPIGMVFGIVLSFLEGRKNTELLVAALSATFIFSTGFVKTVGLLLIQLHGVDELYMPFVTGLLFYPFFLLSTWLLNNSQKPDPEDLLKRSKRLPMNRQKRSLFLKKYGLGFGSLVLIYVVLTVIRDFRDNFIVEFWSETGFETIPQIVTLTEIPVAIVTLFLSGFAFLFRRNLIAFNYGMILSVIGAILILLFTFLFEHSFVSPTQWVIVTGIGIYLPYILFHCLVFERLVALLKFSGNVGFLFYTADSLGYMGSVIVLLSKEYINYKGNWTDFFITLNTTSATGILILILISMIYFNRPKFIKTIEHSP